MNERVLVNMLLQLNNDKPNDMEFGRLTRLLLNKYKNRVPEYPNGVLFYTIRYCSTQWGTEATIKCDQP